VKSFSYLCYGSIGGEICFIIQTSLRAGLQKAPIPTAQHTSISLSSTSIFHNVCCADDHNSILITALSSTLSTGTHLPPCLFTLISSRQIHRSTNPRSPKGRSTPYIAQYLLAPLNPTALYYRDRRLPVNQHAKQQEFQRRSKVRKAYTSFHC
jgi:hypothetical protein